MGKRRHANADFWGLLGDAFDRHTLLVVRVILGLWRVPGRAAERGISYSPERWVLGPFYAAQSEAIRELVGYPLPQDWPDVLNRRIEEISDDAWQRLIVRKWGEMLAQFQAWGRTPEGLEFMARANVVPRT